MINVLIQADEHLPAGDLLHVAMHETAGRETAKVILIYPAVCSERLFLDMYHRHYQPLIAEISRYISKFSIHYTDANDVAQNTFKKLWLKKEQLHLIISPRDYIFIIAKNLLLEGRRRQQREKNHFRHLAKKLSPYTNETEEEIIFRDTRKVFESRVDELPARLKKTYILKKEGYRLKEIAFCMGIREQTVKNNLQKAAKKMERLAEELGVN